MKTAGIVAEYNPFHNGHKYMIDRVRDKGVTHIVAVMSGAAVQRGDVAVFDKHFRAKKAVENGVDLVLELPFPYSCASGEIFARSAVQILAGMGDNVVDNIAFGCECDDIDLLKKAADISTELKESEMVRKALSEGVSYPSAVYDTALKLYGKGAAGLLRSPNNTLAVEYIKAVGDHARYMISMPIKRVGTEHDSSDISYKYASASLIRQRLYSSVDISELCPYSINGQAVHDIYRMQREILFRLSLMDRAELMQLPDCGCDIADRIISVMSACPKSFDEFLGECKSKNVTMARLRRIVMYAVLGVKKSDMFSPPYVRILAFNSRGAEILSKCKMSILPMDTSLKTLEKSSYNAKRIIHLENNAVSFQFACSVGDYSPKNEFRRKITISKD